MIKIQQKDFDVKAELEALKGNNHSIGGICFFIGLVREMAENKKLSAMTLEQYPGMTEKVIKKIENEALQRWSLHSTLIIHRFGRLKPGEQIVLVAAASAHREVAFEACHFLIDFLKTKAPFWKLEETQKGNSWVATRDSDETAVANWKYQKQV